MTCAHCIKGCKNNTKNNVVGSQLQRRPILSSHQENLALSEKQYDVIRQKDQQLKHGEETSASLQAEVAKVRQSL